MINRLRCQCQIAAALTALCLSGATAAHEYWIEKLGQRLILEQGHRSGAHAGEAKLALDPAHIVGVVCLDRNGKAQAAPKPGGTPPGINADCAQVSFRLSSGYWTKTPYDTINKPRTEVKGALQSWLSQETVTRLDQWTPALAKPGALPGLALTLPADPGNLKAGDKFVLRAWLDGKPAADVPVAYDGNTRGATDAEGQINLRVRRNGLQQISASIESPLNDGKADTLIRGATLNFVLP